MLQVENISFSYRKGRKEVLSDFSLSLEAGRVYGLLGKNGAGKTTILDAIAVSVSTFLLAIDGGVSRSILKEDARYEFHDLNGTIDPQHQFPVDLLSTGDCLIQ